MPKAFIGVYFKKASLEQAKRRLIQKETQFKTSYALMEYDQGYIIVSLKALGLLSA